MEIWKAAIGLFLICLLAFSMLTILSILRHDQSQDAIYHVAGSSVNTSINLTETVTAAGSGFITPMTLLVAILFLLAVLLIFRKW